MFKDIEHSGHKSVNMVNFFKLLKKSYALSACLLIKKRLFVLLFLFFLSILLTTLISFIYIFCLFLLQSYVLVLCSSLGAL